MPIFRRYWALALACGAVSWVSAQESVTLRVREKPTDVYHQTVRFSLSTQFDELPEDAQALLGPLLEGDQSLSAVLSIRTRVTDSKDGKVTVRRATTPVSVDGKGLFAMAAPTMRQQLAVITEEVVDEFGVVVRTRVLAGPQPAAQNDVGLGQMFGQPGTGLHFPRRAVKPGDSWTTKDAQGQTVQVRFFDWEQWHSIRAVRLEFTGGTLETGVRLLGPAVALIDPASGRLLYMDMRVQIEQAGVSTRMHMQMEMDRPR